MQPIPYEGTSGPMICQPKYDGVRGVLSRHGMHSRSGAMLNNSGDLLSLFHHIEDAAGCSVYLDGELVAGCFEDTCSLVLSDEGRDASELRFHVFDIVPAGDWQEGTTMPLVERDSWLADVVARVDSPLLLHVLHVMTADVEGAAAECVADGYEGCVAKVPDSGYYHGYAGSWMKWKPVQEVDAVIEGAVMDRGRLHMLLVRHNGRLFNLTAGMRAKARRELTRLHQQRRLSGTVVEVGHEGVTRRGALRFPRFRRLRLDRGA